MQTSPPSQGGPVPSVLIRPVTLDDWSEIRSLHASAIRTPASSGLDAQQSKAFVAIIYAPDYTDTLMTHDLHCAWLDGRLVGTGGWVPSGDAGLAARITSVFVSPFFTRLGIGRRLVAAVEARSAAAGFQRFTVRAYQATSGFFEALGYVRSSHGVVSVGSEHGIPVVFMRKDDGPPGGARRRSDAADAPPTQCP